MSAINAFLDDLAPLCAPEVSREASALARNAGQTMYSIRTDRMKPDQLALIQICNVVGSHLSNGQHHVYRGTLSMIGQDMLTIWTAAISALRDRGYYTDEQADDDMVWIMEQISNVG